jgi:hypothetical protein
MMMYESVVKEEKDGDDGPWRWYDFGREVDHVYIYGLEFVVMAEFSSDNAVWKSRRLGVYRESPAAIYSTLDVWCRCRYVRTQCVYGLDTDCIVIGEYLE